MRGRGVALVYAAVVVVSAVSLSLAPQAVADRVILTSSTNLVNLRQHPPFVLMASAFVEPSVWELWIVVPLVWGLGVLQRWMGRVAVLITVVFGHVGATLAVATILAAGIDKQRFPFSQAAATDVGVSYGLVAVLGLLTVRAPARYRRWFVLVGSLAALGALVVDRSFTDLGHLVAWLIGLALAVLVTRAREQPPVVTGAG
jgi:hypothetical protein